MLKKKNMHLKNFYRLSVNVIIGEVHYHDVIKLLLLQGFHFNFILFVFQFRISAFQFRIRKFLTLMATSKIDNCLGVLIIENYDNGMTPKIISRTFKLPVSTIKTIISIYKKESRITKKPVGGAHNIKVSDEKKIFRGQT
ncbi:hypothetical protein DMUE_3401 [Dictyocoela muelleri]|nr:hypothetical protein DMUE_3401 [Dictyocoela muelleri]